MLGGVVQQGVLPQSEHDHVGLVPGREGGEEIFLSSRANLDSVGNNEGCLLLRHGGHLAPRNKCEIFSIELQESTTVPASKE